MNILITGGTGFIGGKLKNHLIEKGHHIYILTRTPENHFDSKSETYIPYTVDASKLPEIYGVVNLAGESLFGYWTKEKKNKILSSRLNATNQLLELVKNLSTKPVVWINGSAVGFYGSATDIIFTEHTTDASNDFLSSVVSNWESTAGEAEELGIRTVYARFGIVLSKNDGSLPLMALPVKLFIGGKVGDGEQWISWIHIDDAVSLLNFCLLHEKIEGPVNFTAPHPKRNKEFYQILAEVYKRPYWFPTPEFLISLAMGEMAQLITEGQYVLPQRALDSEFLFKYPKLKPALISLKNNEYSSKIFNN